MELGDAPTEWMDGWMDELIIPMRCDVAGCGDTCKYAV